MKKQISSKFISAIVLLVLIYLFSPIPPVSIKYSCEDPVNESVVRHLITERYSNVVSGVKIVNRSTGIKVFLKFKDKTSFSEKKKTTDSIAGIITELIEKKFVSGRSFVLEAENSSDNDDGFLTLKERSFVKEYGIVRKVLLIPVSEIVVKNNPGRDPQVVTSSFKNLTVLISPYNIPTIIFVKSPEISENGPSMFFDADKRTYDSAVYWKYPKEIISVLPIRTEIRGYFYIDVKIGADAFSLKAAKWFPFP